MKRTLEVTWGRVARIWFAMFWRFVLISSGLYLIVYLALHFGGLLGILASFPPIDLALNLGLIFLAGLWALRLTLNIDLNDVRLVITDATWVEYGVTARTPDRRRRHRR